MCCHIYIPAIYVSNLVIWKSILIVDLKSYEAVVILLV